MSWVELFVLAILGHLIGDYLLQNTWMASGKSQRTLEGCFICTVHVVLYTSAVCCMMRTANPLVWVVVAAPHWIIDHWRLGEKWSSLMGGRTVQGIYQMLPGRERDFATAFYAPVYIAVDNTWHFLCLLATIRIFLV